MKYLYIHGGPGFNSNPESELLKDLDLIYWNEISNLRQEQPLAPDQLCYQAQTISLEETIQEAISQYGEIGIIAFSFGAFYLNEILDKYTDAIKDTIVISPITNIDLLDYNIVQIAIDNYKSVDENNKADELEQMRAKWSGTFDDQRVGTLKTATSNINVFPSYWKNMGQAQLYFSHLTEEWSFDETTYFLVRSSLEKLSPKQINSSGKIKILYGKHDPVIKEKQRSLLGQVYVNLQEEPIIFLQSGHYPHLEEMDKFKSLLQL